MNNVNDFYQTESKWLKASELKNKEGKPIKAKLRIRSVEVVEFRDNTKKIGLFFDGKEKGLVLNKTNATLIAEQHGQDMDGWRGKEISIYPTMVDYSGERVEAIRVEQHIPAAAPEDDIPF